MLEKLKGKRLLILGLGKEGRDSFSFLRSRFPKAKIGIADQNRELPKLPRKGRLVKLHLGPNYLKAIAHYDVVVKSPGVPLKALKPFLKKEQLLTSPTNLFFAEYPGTVIGLTGTKGKSTTASLIHHVLKKGGVKAVLAGNIGTPLLSLLGKAKLGDVAVAELSSFQLELARQSPHIAVFLNLFPEHLDHHGTFKAYAAAKANITKFQTKADYFIFNNSGKEIKRIAAKSKAKLMPFTPKREKGALYAAPVQPVFLVAKLFRIPKEKVQKTLRHFKPLPHRLQLLGTYRGITFYNDSLATIPEATIAALDILGNKVATLLVGGYDRRIPFRHLAVRILQSNIRNLILLPTTGQLVWKELEALHAKQGKGNLPKDFRAQTLAQAVKLSFQHTPKDSICLLSPAAASFNMFSDYKERGDTFKHFMIRYGKKARA